MFPFTHNKKIALTAVAIFSVSFSVMLSLSDYHKSSPSSLKANVRASVFESAIESGETTFSSESIVSSRDWIDDVYGIVFGRFLNKD